MSHIRDYNYNSYYLEWNRWQNTLQQHLNISLWYKINIVIPLLEAFLSYSINNITHLVYLQQQVATIIMKVQFQTMETT